MLITPPPRILPNLRSPIYAILPFLGSWAELRLATHKRRVGRGSEGRFRLVVISDSFTIQASIRDISDDGNNRIWMSFRLLNHMVAAGWIRLVIRKCRETEAYHLMTFAPFIRWCLNGSTWQWEKGIDQDIVNCIDPGKISYRIKCNQFCDELFHVCMYFRVHGEMRLSSEGIPCI